MLPSLLLVNSVPGLFLSKPTDWELMRLVKQVGHVCVSNTANDLKDLLVISHLTVFLYYFAALAKFTFIVILAFLFDCRMVPSSLALIKVNFAHREGCFFMKEPW